jgi:glutamate-5-semialdehyde dehydrogenase
MYVDKAADLGMTESLIINAKCQRPGVCNAIETVLVHSAILEKFAATTGRALLKNGVHLRCDERSLEVLSAQYSVPSQSSERSTLSTEHCALLTPAKPEDYRTEFLDLILAIKTVDTLDAAIAHIEANGSHHSDCIITADETAASHFLAEVDSATVYWNASTRFTDGGEFGFGAEIGISTDKLHARGPMGLEELTTYKYLLRGNGQVRG